MKKFFILFAAFILMCGCTKEKSDDVVNEFKNVIESSNSYKLTGKMELRNDEEIFNYNIDVSFLKDNYYKVELINEKNNHKQIILKNDDGLYVITPALNKSFKFDSSWPDNSSQGYILSSLLNDVLNDSNVEIIKNGKQNIIKSKVNYPNNTDLKYQKIYLNDNYFVTKIEVYGDNDLAKIVIDFNDIDLKAGLKKDLFKLENYIENDKCSDDCEQTTMKDIESAIYPLYMPSNTYLSNSELIKNEEENRVILTFSGDKNFVIVEQNANKSLEHEIIPIYGDMIMLNDTIAAMSSNSMYWTSNDIDYYLVSDDLSVSEMVFVASSLGNYSTTIATK